MCVLQVAFNPVEENNFEAVLELFTAGGAGNHLSVTASVVAPSLAITPTNLDLGVTHMGKSQERSLTLSNLTLLPTNFSWEAYGSGGVVEGGEVEVSIEPPQGLIAPGLCCHCTTDQEMHSDTSDASFAFWFDEDRAYACIRVFLYSLRLRAVKLTT